MIVHSWWTTPFPLPVAPPSSDIVIGAPSAVNPMLIIRACSWSDSEAPGWNERGARDEDGAEAVASPAAAVEREGVGGRGGVEAEDLGARGNE